MISKFTALFNARLVLAALLAALGSGAAGYYYGGKHTRDAIESDQARIEQTAREVYNAALQATAEQIASIEIVNTTIRQELEREIRYEKVYGECRHSDDTQRLLNAVLSGEAPAESVSSGELPASDPTER